MTAALSGWLKYAAEQGKKTDSTSPRTLRYRELAADVAAIVTYSYYGYDSSRSAFDGLFGVGADG